MQISQLEACNPYVNSSDSTGEKKGYTLLPSMFGIRLTSSSAAPAKGCFNEFIRSKGNVPYKANEKLTRVLVDRSEDHRT